MYLGQIWLHSSVLLILLASAAGGQNIDRKQGEWGHLAEYIGTYNYEAVLGDDEVSEKLTSMLGNDLERLQRNLTVHGVIGFNGSCLTLTGNAPRRGFDENAYLNVCLSRGSVDVVLTGDGVIQIYSEKSQFRHLDWILRSWVFSFQSDDHFASIPVGTIFIQTD